MSAFSSCLHKRRGRFLERPFCGVSRALHTAKKGQENPWFPCPLLKSPHPSFPQAYAFCSAKRYPAMRRVRQYAKEVFSVWMECSAWTLVRAATLRVKRAVWVQTVIDSAAFGRRAGASLPLAPSSDQRHKAACAICSCTPFPQASPFFSARGGICAPLSGVTPIYFRVTPQGLHGRVAFFMEKCVGLCRGGKDDSKRRRGTMGASPSFEVCSKRPARHMRLESQYPQNKKIQRETNFLISR